MTEESGAASVQDRLTALANTVLRAQRILPTPAGPRDRDLTVSHFLDPFRADAPLSVPDPLVAVTGGDRRLLVRLSELETWFRSDAHPLELCVARYPPDSAEVAGTLRFGYTHGRMEIARSGWFRWHLRRWLWRLGIVWPPA